jgi:hypothetical protein
MGARNHDVQERFGAEPHEIKRMAGIVSDHHETGDLRPPVANIIPSERRAIPFSTFGNTAGGVAQRTAARLVVKEIPKKSGWWQRLGWFLSGA